MITDVPTSNDFRDSGLGFLNLAWDAVMSVAITWDDAEAGLWRSSAEAPEEYWQAAQRPLATALALAHQGTELLLKGNICAISPYLLIAGDPRNWPQASQTRNVPFSEFRTIDSQDLIRSHDSVSNSKLTEQFKTQFERVRNVRNTILHSVAPGLRIEVKELIVFILETHHTLVQERGWIMQRRRHLSGTPESIAFVEALQGEDDLVREMMLLIDVLEPNLILKYFGFDKKQRRYICPECQHRYPNGKTPFVALLDPNAPDSKTACCVVCGERLHVERRPCRDSTCKGNVVWVKDYEKFIFEMCLTCGTCQNPITANNTPEPIVAKRAEGSANVVPRRNG